MLGLQLKEWTTFCLSLENCFLITNVLCALYYNNIRKKFRYFEQMDVLKNCTQTTSPFFIYLFFS